MALDLAKLPLVLALSALSVACYPIPPDTTGLADGASSSLEGDQTVGDAGPADANSYARSSWTAIYLRYLSGSGTLGHCAESGCHATKFSGIQCDTAANCYSTLSAAGFMSPSGPTLTSVTLSPLTWINPGSLDPMPRDGTDGNDADAAVADMEAWAAAGAPSN